MSKNFYITTTLPYVNADPHVGFAMEIIRADTIARYKKILGYEVFFNTGTDEHGQKLLVDAEKAGVEIKKYVDEYAEKFRGLKQILNISEDVHFVRTTDPNHEKSAQEFWKRCSDNGYIYKKNYQTKYCVGCELNKTDSELDENGECPIHPGRKIELIDEENYFFKFSAFQKPLLEFYKKNDKFVVPEFRFHEIKSFVERGLEDFSISRLKSKMSWGVPVPGDDAHVMYVWFDALVNYISTLAWPAEALAKGAVADTLFEKFWIKGTPTQYCGKDNLRQQSAMWQAMLMAAGLPSSHQIVINGFFTGDGGIKMSKSVGNVSNPYDVVAEFGTDALRYFVLAEVSMFEDSPFTMERFKEAYNAKLANGLGNLTSRIMKMVVTYDIDISSVNRDNFILNNDYFNKFLDQYDIKSAMDHAWDGISITNEMIQKMEPFKKIKVNPEEAKKEIIQMTQHLFDIAYMIQPALPDTAKKILSCIKEKISPVEPLFLRKE